MMNSLYGFTKVSISLSITQHINMLCPYLTNNIHLTQTNLARIHFSFFAIANHLYIMGRDNKFLAFIREGKWMWEKGPRWVGVMTSGVECKEVRNESNKISDSEIHRERERVWRCSINHAFCPSQSSLFLSLALGSAAFLSLFLSAKCVSSSTE